MAGQTTRGVAASMTISRTLTNTSSVYRMRANGRRGTAHQVTSNIREYLTTSERSVRSGRGNRS